MPKPNVEVVVIGNIVKETIIRENDIIGPVLGSPCAYTGLALARGGVRSGIVSYMGDDFKKEIEHEMSIVDMEGSHSYLCTTENHLLYNKNEESNRVEYSKVSPMITYEDIPKRYLGAEMFFVCPMNFEVDIKLCKKLHEEKRYVIADLGGYGGTTSYNHFSIDTLRGKSLIDDLCEYSDMIKASSDDLRYIFPGMTLEESMEYLLEKGASRVFITRGKKGAALWEKGRVCEYIGAAKVEKGTRLNLTGAGDVFTAGVITAFLEKPKDARFALQYGTTAASLVLSKTGGCESMRMPTDRMIRREMEEDS